ncbi:MAG: extracellular solute-binding protein [Lachnospirales bacterium]
MKFRKIGITAGAMMLTMSLLAGCAGDTSKAETPEVKTETDEQKETETGSEPVEIRMTFRDDGIGADGASYKHMERVGKELTESNPNIIVNISPIQASEGDYFAKIALALQSPDTAPDVVTEDTFMLPSDVKAGYLHPLTDYLAEWDEWGDFYESLKEGVKGEDGVVYAVPYNTDTRGLYYNQDIFDAAGIATPWEPKNWEDILIASRQIKENVGGSVVPIWFNSGIATGEATSMQTYEMLLYGTGERLQDESGKWIVESQGILDTLTWIDKVYKEQLGPPLSQVLNGQGSNNAARIYMPQGNLGIQLDGSWTTGNYKETGASPWPEYTEKLKITRMPTQNGDFGGTVSLAGGWGYAIPANSQHKDEAWEYVKALSSFENLTDRSMLESSMTTRTDIASSEEYLSIPIMSEMTEFLDTSYFRPKNESYPQVSTAIQSMVEAVVTGTAPVDAMKEYSEAVRRVVGDDNAVALEYK